VLYRKINTARGILDREWGKSENYTSIHSTFVTATYEFLILVKVAQ
jgi:hypothetical protein